MNILRAAGFAALFSVMSLTQLFAQDITLRSHDGGVELSGVLLGFDGEFYRIDTKFGELTVDGSGVTCEGVGCPSLIDYVADLTFSGSATMGRVLMPALIESFARREAMTALREVEDDPNRFTYVLSKSDKVVGRFHFHLTNTDEGFADLLADEADIVMALREIRPEETNRARAVGLGDLTKANRSRVVALDGMVPIAAPGNPVNAISLANLSMVLSGEIDNWTALGGPDAPLTLHMHEAGSGLVQGIEDRLLRPVRAEMAPATRYKDTKALANAVARDPFGLGVVSFSDIGNAKALVLRGTCGFQLAAARRSIKTEDYPLTAPMFLYTPARRLPKLARDFMGFVHSPVAQIAIRRAGFVDQAPEEVALDLQGDRIANAVRVAKDAGGLGQLQELIAALEGHQRLSVSFRFEAGSSRLDAQSRSNVLGLARALEAGLYDGRSILFVGFSDGQGPFPANKTIAQRRAKAAMDAVVSAAETADLDRVNIAQKAFGEAMPMACDDSSWGRQVNRRVEVWVK